LAYQKLAVANESGLSVTGGCEWPAGLSRQIASTAAAISMADVGIAHQHERSKTARAGRRTKLARRFTARAKEPVSHLSGDMETARIVRK
jgi:uncharacterized protein (DUF849 family)